jgi:hypothetical protein
MYKLLEFINLTNDDYLIIINNIFKSYNIFKEDIENILKGIIFLIILMI